VTTPSECTVIHTKILRCMLAAEDCYAYWRRVDTSVPPTERSKQAFEQRWFGTKSEARVHVLVWNMVERFDAFPDALALLKKLDTVPASLRPLICHLHTQLSDPIYRQFTGDYLPMRRGDGHTFVDRETVARWVDTLYPGRWAASTCIKFGTNMLSTAFEAGLVGGPRDPRKIAIGSIPNAIVGYLLYLLRDVRIEGSLTDNMYMRSLGIGPGEFHTVASRVPGIRFGELGGVGDLTFLEPSLAAWGEKYLGGGR
jgi:hypothetical protein